MSGKSPVKRTNQRIIRSPVAFILRRVSIARRLITRRIFRRRDYTAKRIVCCTRVFTSRIKCGHVTVHGEKEAKKRGEGRGMKREKERGIDRSDDSRAIVKPRTRARTNISQFRARFRHAYKFDGPKKHTRSFPHFAKSRNPPAFDASHGRNSQRLRTSDAETASGCA